MQHDFRSDTVTKPSEGMRAAMASAEVGDDVYRDDPTMLKFETAVAERLGKEAAAFMPSGTQSNLVALMAHCARGEEYIAGQQAHVYKYEAGGAAVLGSIQPQPVTNQPDGTLALKDIEAAIKPVDFHFAQAKLFCLENTIGGQVLSLEYMKTATDFARKKGLSTHLDGARIFNAAVALGVPVAEVAANFDTVSVCFSKGLGTPLGSVLVGPKPFIEKARWIRKMVGGGLRQAGIIAAAGLYALEHNVERLSEDHANATRLADGLKKHQALSVRTTPTNMAFVTIADDISGAFCDHLADNGIKVMGGYGSSEQRWVTHLDVNAESVDAALQVVDRFFA